MATNVTTILSSPSERKWTAIERTRATGAVRSGSVEAAGSLTGTIVRVGSTGVLFVGAGMLARSFSALAGSAQAYSLFWAGLALLFLAAFAISFSPGVQPWHQVVSLLTLGAAMWLPTYLRSPAYPIFQDELFHVQSLDLMAQLGTTRIPITLFPIAGDYPGLEMLGLSTLFSTGMPAAWVIRLVPLALHMLIPVLAYYTLRACGLAPRAATFGAFIYIANSSYYFFHSTFSYETWGIALFLLVTLLAVRRADPARKQKLGTTLFLMSAVVAIVMTHHISSALAGAMLILLFVCSYVTRFRKRGSVKSPLGDATIFAAVLWLTWLLYSATRSVRYLSSGVIDRATAILAFILQEQGQPRNLFTNSRLPLPEQIIAYVYPVAIFVLAAIGVFVVLPWRKKKQDTGTSGTIRLAFFLFGPLAWAVTAPLIFTRSSDMVYRAWPFLFLGVAFYAALGLGNWITKGGQKQWARMSVGVFAAALVLAGSVIVGDNQAGRFRPADVQAAAGPETLTEDLVGAAHWLRATSGDSKLVVGDKSSTVGFAAFGMQRTNLWETWTPFYLTDTKKAQAFLDKNKVDFVAVDMRDARFPARYQVYFNQAELFRPETQGRVGKPMQQESLTKFENMPALQRVYDNGDIVLYANAR